MASAPAGPKPTRRTASQARAAAASHPSVLRAAGSAGPPGAAATNEFSPAPIARSSPVGTIVALRSSSQ